MPGIFNARIFGRRRVGDREEIRLRVLGSDGEPIDLEGIPSVVALSAGFSSANANGEAALQLCKSGRRITLSGTFTVLAEASLVANALLFVVAEEYLPAGSIVVMIITYNGANIQSTNRAKLASNGEMRLESALGHAFGGAPNSWIAFSTTWIAKP